MTVLAAVEGPDVLTDVLSTLRLRGRLFCRSELASPWSLGMPRGDEAHFHLIERGSCLLRLGRGIPPVALSEGDFVLLPRGDGHVLASDARTLPVAIGTLVAGATRPAGVAVFRHGGNGAEAVLVCGSFRFEARESHPLLGLLPPVLHIRADAEGSRTIEWLKTSLRFLSEEARLPRPGAETLMSRLTDILFVQVLRAWIETEPAGARGWLGALRDPQLSRALAALHGAPQESWTVGSLAARAGMSRSSFASRFTERVGETPLAYLTRWRMQIASDLLRGPRLSVSEVAARVGYESEAAFSKAFKRLLGVPPGALRREASAEDRPAPSR